MNAQTSQMDFASVHYFIPADSFILLAALGQRCLFRISKETRMLVLADLGALVLFFHYLYWRKC